MPSLMIESPLQLQAAGAWGSLYSVQEPVKPRHTSIPSPAAAPKKPAYGVIRRKNLETCTEALGCETGAVDTASAGNGSLGALEQQEEAMAGRVRRSERHARARPLPPPLTTLGASRVRMVHERRDGRLEMYAVRTLGALEAERCGGRLRMRLRPLPCRGAGNLADPRERQGPKETKEGEEDYGFSMYLRGGWCVEPEDGTAAARRGKPWELELHQYPCMF
jgi:hypothetical protein